ncbi:MAG TPA: lysophospholipid acyltransferase family protein [Dehalococcoidia bacterium]|nr:lysophospholipid acyltransferase family protein [Dehalococcoidia bacterium]HLB29865.1 lysophospholipid acyltransferase family protein [Dehalococcoidia bacterium]
MLKYIAFLAGVHIFSRLPIAIGYRLGEWVADIAFLLHRPLRRAVADNMRHVLGPEAARGLVRRMAREVFRNAARYYVDMVRLPRIKPQELLERRITIHGYEHLEGALAQGRGVIIASAHFGNPEMAVQVALAKGIPVTVLTEPLKPPIISRLLDGLRSCHGQDFLPVSRASIKKALGVIRGGGVIALACDRDVQGRSIPVPFFGAPALMPTGILELAMRTGAAVIPVFSCRRPKGRYEIFIEPPLALVNMGRSHEDLRAGVTALLSCLEGYVRREPGQWTVMEQVWDRFVGEAPRPVESPSGGPVEP